MADERLSDAELKELHDDYSNLAAYHVGDWMDDSDVKILRALAELRQLRAKHAEAMAEVTDGIYFWDDRRDTALFAVCRVLDQATYDLLPPIGDDDDDDEGEGAKAAYLKWHPSVAAQQRSNSP